MAARDQLKGSIYSNPRNPVDLGFQVTLTEVAEQISMHLNLVPNKVRENFLKFGMGLVDKSDYQEITIIWQSQKDLPEKCYDVLNLWAVKRELKWENVIEQLRQIGLTGLADNLNNELDRSNQPMAPNITEKSTIPDMSNVKVENLWTKDDLEEIVRNGKTFVSLPKDIEDAVLHRVVVLLVTVNDNETLATRSYLKPLDGHDNIYKFSKRIDYGEHQSEIAMYYIGTYGVCPTAVRKILPGREVDGGASSVPRMAYVCFPNLGAIIGVGVACGIEGKKVRMCDVLVSSKIANYDNGRAKDGKFLSRGEAIKASSYLIGLFTDQFQWPNDSIKERLKGSNMHIPKVKSGVILSGPYLIDDPVLKKRFIEDFAPEAIGIEMEGTYLFAAAKQSTTLVIIIKAVCDYGDGKKDKEYQPTAALMAADLVHECLNDYQVEAMLKKKSNNKDTL